MDFTLSILEFVGLAVTVVVAAWARRKFKSIWAKVLFFFVAVIAGNVVYFISGIVCAIILASGDRAMVSANAHAVGANGWSTIGASVVAAIAGLVSSLPDRIWPVRKSNQGTKIAKAKPK